MSQKVYIDEITQAVNKTLEDYANATDALMHKVVDQASKTAVRELRATSPRRKGGGAYAKGWGSKIDRQNRHWAYKRIVYNEKHYRLTHLLEKGHRQLGTIHVGKKTWVDARPHIGKVEQTVVEEMINELRNGI